MSITGTYIVNDIRSEVLEPNPTFFSNARILDVINQAQNKFVAKTRVLQSFAYTSTIQGQADYPMPPDWLGSEKVFFNDSTDVNSPNWRPLTPTNLEKLGQENPNFLSTASTKRGSPRLYYVLGSTLYLYPRPAANGNNDIFLFYESKPVQLLTLTDSLSIDDSLYDAIHAYVMAKLWKQDNEDAKSKEEMENFKAEIGEGFKWKNKRILDGKWKMDIESFMPYTYGGSSSSTGSPNPLNL